MNGHGGKRANAGKRVDPRLVSIRQKALETGVTPLEIILAVMNEAWREYRELSQLPEVEVADLVGARKLAFEAAVAACPYVHPRLAQIKNEGGESNKPSIQITVQDTQL